MLYDNALLANVYLEAFQLTGKPLYAEIAEQIFTYVLRDMTSPEGAFYSAEDADSEGVEGKFYVFSREEIEEALGLEDMHSYCNVYGITPEGNFEGEKYSESPSRSAGRDCGAYGHESAWSADPDGGMAYEAVRVPGAAHSSA
ncbi:hypothetical protein ACFTAO_27155 [Paenibacillus rhizoplanae]